MVEDIAIFIGKMGSCYSPYQQPTNLLAICVCSPYVPRTPPADQSAPRGRAPQDRVHIIEHPHPQTLQTCNTKPIDIPIRIGYYPSIKDGGAR